MEHGYVPAAPKLGDVGTFSAVSYIPSKLIVTTEPASLLIVLLWVLHLVDLDTYLVTPSNSPQTFPLGLLNDNFLTYILF